ncbi:MAG TPA: dihydropteroate synthase [Candidatus Limnocylindria bacterium]|nr:dihydropteroate synthase [Candidatus Limnocylindria bacterium]
MATALEWGSKTYLMGIVNVTPDSFSGDGLATEGRSTDEIVTAALAQARAFVDAGAEIIDVGAESTRPRSAYGEHPEIDAQTEAALAVPVVRAIAEELRPRALVSIDTSKGSVAAAALEAGATIVNDVWAAQRDRRTADAAAHHDAHLVLMHNQDGVDYPDGVFEAVVRELGGAVEHAIGRGVARERLIVDPGIGFGKGTDENLELLHRLRELKEALGGLPLLVGTSRKRFIGAVLDGAAPDDRVEGTAATVALAIAAGADIVRVHDVAHIARTRRVADAIIRR